MRLLVSMATLLTTVLIGSSALAADWAPASRIAIQVKRGDWGAARTQDIEKVLALVADVLVPYFPRHASERIVVERGKQGPRILPDKSRDGAYQVVLDVQDTRWDQFTYQFSHELCHVFTNYEHREIGSGSTPRDHQWFEETLCEAVSLFALKQVASRWELSPPSPGWEEYSSAFREYADRLLSERHRHWLAKESLAEWYRENRQDLDRNPYLREKNEFLANRLLTLLESTPGSLESIAYLNLEGALSAKTLKAYLESWYSCCPEKYRAFIGQVIALFEGRNSAIAVALTSFRQLSY